MTKTNQLEINSALENNLIEASLSTTAPRFSGKIILGLTVWIVLAFVVGFSVRTLVWQFPQAGSPEVGFARDMIVHHANAVEMAILVRDRTNDAEMRTLTLDMMLTQQAQIGQMQGWLTIWQQPIAQTEPVMSWMGMSTEGLMPGLASAEQMAQLSNLKGQEIDGLFLSLMIPHHQAALEMATHILKQSQGAEVRSLAESILVSQASEIEVMQDLLQRKGFPISELETIVPHSKHNE